MTPDTCKVCKGPMGAESSDGYCSLDCFDAVTIKRPRLRHACMTCGNPVKSGIRFCGTKCLGQARMGRMTA